MRSISLLSCFHPDTSFVFDLQFYNIDTEATLAFHKSWLGESLLAFLSVLLYQTKSYVECAKVLYLQHCTK